MDYRVTKRNKLFTCSCGDVSVGVCDCTGPRLPRVRTFDDGFTPRSPRSKMLASRAMRKYGSN
jgi:hypothetical protein